MAARWRIFRTLLAKDLLRFRYNPALQFVLVLFVVMAALITFSRAATEEAALTVYVEEGAGSPFARYLERWDPKLDLRGPAPTGHALEPTEVRLWIPPSLAPHADTIGKGDAPEVRVEFSAANRPGGLRLRETLRAHLLAFLEVDAPVMLSATDDAGEAIPADERPEPPERSRLTEGQATKEIAMVTIVTLSLLVISFNLFSMMLSEEKSSKTLLAQMISPATLGDIVRAKFAFYMTINLVLAAAVAAIYAPHALARPLYWVVVAMGSVTYMSLALVIVAYTEKQSTASLLTLGYLFFLAIVLLLSGQLRFFAVLQRNLPETYIFRFVARLFSTDPSAYLSPLSIDFLKFAAIVVAIVSGAMLLFERKGLRAA